MTAYRTAKGKVIDMSTMSSAHEKTRAVGNMGVNARGDVLDAHNRVVRENTSRVNAEYNNVVTPKSVEPSTRETIRPDELTDAEREFEDDDEDTEK